MPRYVRLQVEFRTSEHNFSISTRPFVLLFYCKLQSTPHPLSPAARITAYYLSGLTLPVHSNNSTTGPIVLPSQTERNLHAWREGQRRVREGDLCHSGDRGLEHRGSRTGGDRGSGKPYRSFFGFEFDFRLFVDRLSFGVWLASDLAM